MVRDSLAAALSRTVTSYTWPGSNFFAGTMTSIPAIPRIVYFTGSLRSPSTRTTFTRSVAPTSDSGPAHGNPGASGGSRPPAPT
ncbi:hypothetical protein [Nannocystis radixulma]|uniref:Uncharacterized protein n=1 Tax=Nannocystis radixulma TaxID=2995305 RepID=A0ABT5B4X5_9BACT|nr:hypothetical protein [Nannocystis radixulma]MDC0669169.1 hypothetical protein [Nannocystis radixulma]